MMSLQQSVGKSRLIKIILISLLVLAPLFFGGVYTWSTMSLAAVSFFLFFLYPELAFQNVHISRNVAIAGLLVLSIMVLQLALTTVNRYNTCIQLILWCHYLLVFVLVQQSSQETLKRLMMAMILVGVFQGVYGFSQLLSEQEMVLWRVKEDHLRYMTGTFFNRNHLAGYLELVIGILVGFCCYAWKKRQWLLLGAWGLGLLFVTTTLFKTGSRMGVFSLVSSTMFFVFFYKESSKRGRWLFLVAFLCFLTLGTLISYRVLGGRLEEVSQSMISWDGGRLLAWKHMLAMAGEHLWMGVGLGNFGWVYPEYQPMPLVLGWKYAHNDYLQLLTEIGLPAFLLLATLFIGLWIKMFSSLLRLKSEWYPLAWGCMLGLTSLLIHGAADFNFSRPANMMAFVIVVGIAWRLQKISETEKGEASDGS